MKLQYISICLLLVFIAGCRAPAEIEEGVSDFSTLKGNTFQLEVTKSARQPLVSSPMVELKESDYTVVTEPKSYTVAFSADGTTVSVEPGSIKGTKSLTADNTILYFALTNGIFAGGRFEVRIQPTGFEAELTIYGSGLPIVLSERGNLVSGK